jgi:hypothetical protein
MPKIITLCLLKSECPFKRTYRKGKRRIPTCGFKGKCNQKHEIALVKLATAYKYNIEKIRTQHFNLTFFPPSKTKQQTSGGVSLAV